MVIFARALVSEARIMILDEPTSALDLKNQILVLDWMTRLSHQDGLTILFTTHHPHHALTVVLNSRRTVARSEAPFGSEYSALKVCVRPDPAFGVTDTAVGAPADAPQVPACTHPLLLAVTFASPAYR